MDEGLSVSPFTQVLNGLFRCEGPFDVLFILRQRMEFALELRRESVHREKLERNRLVKDDLGKVETNGRTYIESACLDNMLSLLFQLCREPEVQMR